MLSTRGKRSRHWVGWATLAVCVGVGVGLSGCATASPQSPVSSTRHVAPVVVDVASLDGKTIPLPRSTVLDINVPTGQTTGWKATFEQKGMALFQPGSHRGGLETNPGILPLRQGTTKVTLQRGTSDTQKVAFTLTITPAPTP